MKKCPKCNYKRLTLVLNRSAFHPTGATGGGLWYFRTFDLYECPECEEYFYVHGELVRAEPLYGNDIYKRK